MSKIITTLVVVVYSIIFATIAAKVQSKDVRSDECRINGENVKFSISGLSGEKIDDNYASEKLIVTFPTQGIKGNTQYILKFLNWLSETSTHSIQSKRGIKMADV